MQGRQSSKIRGAYRSPTRRATLPGNLFYPPLAGMVGLVAPARTQTFRSARHLSANYALKRTCADEAARSIKRCGRAGLLA